MALRFLLVALLLPSLVACRHAGDPAAGGDGREVVFYDAAGNRMVVGMSEPAPVAAGKAADSTLPSAGNVAEAAPAPAASEGQFSFNGETFTDVDAFERAMDERDSERFYVVPDGTGKRQTLKQSDVSPSDAGTDGPVPAATPIAPVSTADACGTAVRLPLIPVEARERQNLTFPVVEGGKRYAGYLVPVPAGAAGAVSVWSWIKKQKRVSVSLGVLDESGAVVAAVNNFATEIQPESMFRYGRAGGRVPLAGMVTPGTQGRIAVMDGHLVARRLPPSCRGIMGNWAQFSPEGLVSLDFRVSAGN